MKHTPGPWHPIDYAGYWEIQTEPFYGETQVLHQDRFSNAEANAKLCAAAPDLFEACLEFIRKVESGEARSNRSYKQMKEAIKKATE